MYLVVITITVLLVFHYQTAHCELKDNATVWSTHCTSGFPNRSVTHGNSQTDRNRQYIFPSINFTCYGNITRWIFWVTNNNDRNDRHPEFQIWRLNNGTQDYIKVGSTTVMYDEHLARDPQNDDQRYEYPLGEHEEMPFEPGDILGIHIPIRSQFRRLIMRQQFEGNNHVVMGFYRTARYPLDTFQTTGLYLRTATRDLPMITVQVERSVTTTVLVPHYQSTHRVALQSSVVPTSISKYRYLPSSHQIITVSPLSTVPTQVGKQGESSSSQWTVATYGGIGGGVASVAIIVVVTVMIALIVVLAKKKHHKILPTRDSKVISFNGSVHSKELCDYTIDYDVPAVLMNNPAYKVVQQQQTSELCDMEYDQTGIYDND